MADSMEMAGLAFGARRRVGLVGRLSHLARGAGGKRPRGGAHHKKHPRKKPTAHHGSRGIRFSNDFTKAVLLLAMVKGLAHA